MNQDTLIFTIVSITIIFSALVFFVASAIVEKKLFEDACKTINIHLQILAQKTNITFIVQPNRKQNIINIEIYGNITKHREIIKRWIDDLKYILQMINIKTNLDK